MSSFAEVEKTQEFFNYVYSNLGYLEFSSLFAESTGQAWVEEKWRIFHDTGNNVHKLMGSLDRERRSALYQWYRISTDREN